MINENSFTYDYKTVKVKREMETMTVDAYANLGWEFTGSSLAEGAIFHVNLSFKRDRKIANKAQLLKAQEQVDGLLLSIDEMQNSKRSAGTIPAISVGTAGALTLGGGMSLVMVVGTTAAIAGGIVLGVFGIGICCLAWLVYKKVKKIKIAKLNPLLESEYDKLADICESMATAQA